MTKKWLLLSAMLAGGTMLFEGCLGAFWQGWRQGWPDNRWASLAVDVANEALFG